MEKLDRSQLPLGLGKPFPAPDLFVDRVAVDGWKVAVTFHLGPVALPDLLPYFGTVGLQAFITSALAAGHLVFGVLEKSEVTFFTGALFETPPPGEGFERLAAGEPLTLELDIEEKRSRASSSDPTTIRKTLAFACHHPELLTTRAEGHFSLSSPADAPSTQIHGAETTRPVLAPYLVEHACLERDRYELVEGVCRPEGASAYYRMTSCYNPDDFHLSVLQTDLLVQELVTLHARQALGLTPRHRLACSIRFGALTTDPEAIRLEVHLAEQADDHLSYAFELGDGACTGTIDLAV